MLTRRLASFLLLFLLVPCCWAVNSDWTTPIAPFRIADGLYYVGGRDLAAYLVTTPAGNILINANYTTSPPQIRHSVEQLGFRWKDTRVLLISHAHIDHAGGAAQILRETGAKFEVMDGDVRAMESGGKSDFAFGSDKSSQFPAAHVDRVLHDGDIVSLGGTSLVAHKTAGHTPGDTSWSLRAHVPGDPAQKLRDAVIVGSVSVLSEYRLVNTPGGRQASYPGIADDYRASFRTLRALPCELFLASHGSLFDMLRKRDRMPGEGDRVWIDPAGYQRMLAEAENTFHRIFAEQEQKLGRRP